MTATHLTRSVRTAHDPNSMSAVSGRRAQSARYASNKTWRDQQQHGAVARSVRTAHDPSSMPAVSGRRAQSARYASNRIWRDQQQHGAVARSVRTAHDPSSMSAVSDHRAQSARYASNRTWRGRRRQRGVVAIEFALMFMFGLLPLMLLTFSGVITFAAKQSLELAAADGARAALHYQTDISARQTEAENIATKRISVWLPAEATSVSTNTTCGDSESAGTDGSTESGDATQCITVITKVHCPDASQLPICYWIMGKPVATATIQLPPGSGS